MKDRARVLTTNERAQSTDLPGVMLALIIAAVIGFIGVFVIDEVRSETDVAGNTAMGNASDSLSDAVESAFGLVGIAFIVLILSVVIVYLYAVRGR